MEATEIPIAVPPPNVFDQNCPTRQVLDRIGDRWTVLVVLTLLDRTLRFTELRRAIPGVTPKALTATLRALERDGLMERRIYAEVPPRVEYSLTPLGRSLEAPLAAIKEWAEANITEIEAARARGGRS
jgi:DNA-binding HxlR family transcriptional regulator